MVARAVFLDRDGVINENMLRDGQSVAPTRLEDFRLLPGVEDGIGRLRAAGFRIVVVTNQPDVASGRTSWNILNAMHAELRRRLWIDDIRVCPHLDADGCDCRKPKPGMLLAAAAEHGLTLTDSYLVGDRWRDVDAGRAAGCCTIFIAPGGTTSVKDCQPDFVAGSLSDAVDVILRHVGGTLAVPEGTP